MFACTCGIISDSVRSYARHTRICDHAQNNSVPTVIPKTIPLRRLSLSGDMADWSQADQPSQTSLQIFSETELAQNVGPNDLTSGTPPHAAGNFFNIENDGQIEDNEVNEVVEVHQVNFSDRDSEPDEPPENMGMTNSLKLS